MAAATARQSMRKRREQIGNMAGRVQDTNHPAK